MLAEGNCSLSLFNAQSLLTLLCALRSATTILRCLLFSVITSARLMSRGTLNEDSFGIHYICMISDRNTQKSKLRLKPNVTPFGFGDSHSLSRMPKTRFWHANSKNSPNPLLLAVEKAERPVWCFWHGDNQHCTSTASGMGQSALHASWLIFFGAVM